MITRPFVRLAIAFALLALATPLGAQPATPASPARTVTMPLATYERLRAGSPRADVPPPPLTAAVAAVAFDLRVEREDAHGAIVLDGTVFAAGQSLVPLPAGGTLVEARAAGVDVPLMAPAAGPAAIVAGPGPFRLALDWRTVVRTQPGRASLSLPVPVAGAARVTLDIGGTASDVRIANGVATAVTPAGERTRVEATLAPGTVAEVSWTARDAAPAATPTATTPPAPAELRLLSQVTTLLTLGEADVRMTALVDLTVARGRAEQVTLELPEGYRLDAVRSTSMTPGPVAGGAVRLTAHDSAATRHQVLVLLERALPAESTTLATAVVRTRDARREQGEIAVEAAGTLTVVPAAVESLQRIDVREVNATMQALAQSPLLAAFRYQRGARPPALALSVQRFTAADVVPAVAEYAQATTLITDDGRALTEVRLTVRNRAQRFMRLALPAGATVVSAMLDDAPVKPVGSADGVRVPLARAGARAWDTTEVSFVYLHAGTPFARRGDTTMSLPRMDVPIGLLRWELFVPERYDARAVGGTAIESRVLERGTTGPQWPLFTPASAPLRAAGGRVRLSATSTGLPGQVRGRVTDVQGAVLPGVTVDINGDAYTRTVVTNEQGAFVVDGVPSGRLVLSTSLAGFISERATVVFDQRPLQVDVTLAVAALMETITVTAASPVDSDDPEPAPESVVDLQQRVAGVLPIPITVPRTGRAMSVVAPLVVDAETTVQVRYRRR